MCAVLLPTGVNPTAVNKHVYHVTAVSLIAVTRRSRRFLGNLLFWFITQRVVVIYNRSFGNNLSVPSEDGNDGSPHLLRGGSLKSRRMRFLLEVTVTLTVRRESGKSY
jgi:hypothetical protein